MKRLPLILGCATAVLANSHAFSSDWKGQPPAVKRQMASQLICEIVNHPELTNAGAITEELHGYIDTATAVSARSAHPREAAQFIQYITQPGGFSLWYARGLTRARN